jgi:hypothetical protein
LLIVLATLVACDREHPVPASSAAVPERPSRTLPLPVSTASGELRWDVPEGWVVEPPSSSMRRAQYRVAGPAGDGECVVFYFGAGQGGDPLSNAERWAKQFTQPDGGSSLAVMQRTLLEQSPLPVHLVEVTGTYNGGMTASDQPAVDKPGYMLLGAIVEGSEGPWFFKFTGPERTLRAQRDAFVAMMRSVRAGS